MRSELRLAVWAAFPRSFGLMFGACFLAGKQKRRATLASRSAADCPLSFDLHTPSGGLLEAWTGRMCFWSPAFSKQGLLQSKKSLFKVDSVSKKKKD